MLIRLVLFYLLVSVAAVGVSAQTGDAPSRAVAPEPSIRQGETLREREPKVFMLKDAQGRRIYVPDFSFERWEELIQRERNLLPPRPPTYTFTDEIVVTGQVVEDGYAELDVQCRLQLVPASSDATGATAAAEWHRIPFRFPNAIRTNDLEHVGPGEALFVYDEQREGHVVWLRAPAGSEHVLRWKMKGPLQQVGSKTAFGLRIPPHPTRLTLTIPGESLDITVSNPDEHLLRRLPGDAPETRIEVESVGGDIELQWEPRENAPPVLESTVNCDVRIIGEQLEWTAALKVRSYGKPVEAFQVRLPPGAELVPTARPDLQLTRVTSAEASEPPAAGSGGRVVEVRRRDGRPAVEFDVTLHAIEGGSDARLGTPQETAGFEVLGAVRQSGSLQFEVEGEWNVDWVPGPYVRQVSSGAEPLSPDGAVARFVFHRQPFSLQVRVAAKESRLSVDPTYVLDVDTDQVSLDARLRYRISGGRARTLLLDMPGWTVERIGPRELFTDFAQQGDQVEVQLSPNAQGGAGDLELRLEAYQSYRPDAQVLRITLPRPQAATAAPAAVAVLSAENVQLAPRTEELKGLVADARGLDIPLPVRRQLPLLYQEDVSNEPAVFATEVLIRQRQVQAAVHSEVRFADGFVEIAQQLMYTIEFEPLNTLMLSIPVRFAQSDQWEVTLEGSVLPVSISYDSADVETNAAGTPTRAFLEVDLLEPRLGSCELELHYRAPFAPVASPGKSTLYDLQLVQPVENTYTRVLENTLRLSAADYWQANIDDPSWTPLASVDQPFATASEPLYRVEGSVDTARLEVTLARPQRQGTIALERVWLQSWLTATVRRDRAVYRLLTNNPSLQLQLPDGISDLEVAVNGQRWRRFTLSDNQLTVELDAPTAVRHYTLELWYWSDARSTPLGRITAPIPPIADAEHAQRVYWQLTVPRTEHLLWSPSNLTPEYVWEWNRSHWGRWPNRDQAALEELLGASVQDPLPIATNQYLFSSVGPLESVDFYTAARAVLVVFISGITLAIGLMLIYLPSLRHPAAAVVFGVAVLSIGLVYPEPAMLAAQAAVLGLGLVLLARLLQWTVTLRRYRRPLFAELTRPAMAPEPQGGATLVESAGSSRVPTTVSPGSYSVSAVESEP